MKVSIFAGFASFFEKNYFFHWPSGKSIDVTGKKPQRLPCYGSLHVCDTFCCKCVYVNTHFEVFLFKILIEHTLIFTYTVDGECVNMCWLNIEAHSLWQITLHHSH